MGGRDGCRGAAGRFSIGCAALTVALSLSGCGMVASVSSTVYSSGEALATIAKQAMEGEGGTGEETRFEQERNGH